MSLLVECLESAGQIIYCRPTLEMGWLRLDATGMIPVARSPLESPVPFRVRVDRFFTIDDKPRGLLGRVEEPGHPFDTLLVVAGTSGGGPFGFDRHLCIRWDIEVGEGPISGAGWPRVELVSSVHTGFAVIASSQAVLDETMPPSDEGTVPQTLSDVIGGSERRTSGQTLKYTPD